MLTYIFAIVVVLGVLIFVHELGHFIAAKIFGVRVERFSIGFPPRLFGKQIGDTDYCVSAIPLGGYVKLSGMIDESLDTSTLTGQPYEFMSKPLYQKVIIITAGVIMNFFLAVGIFGMMTWIQGESVYPTTTIGYLEPGGIADSLGFQKHDKILQVNDKPVQHWQEVSQAFLNNFGKDTRYLIEREGRTLTLAMNWDHLKLKDVQRLGVGPFIPAEIGQLVPGYPASESQLQVGDRIIAINDSAVADWYQMTEIIHARPGKPLVLAILRGGDTLQISITTRAEKVPNAQGEEQEIGMIGIGRPVQHLQIGFFPAMVRGFQQTIFWAQTNINGFVRVLSGKDSARETLAGPIAIAKLAGDTARQSIWDLFRLIAILSVVLAMINILPIPALDGGHLMIILIEGFRRKPLSVKTKMMVQQIGMFFLLILMVFVFYNDIARLLGLFN